MLKVMYEGYNNKKKYNFIFQTEKKDSQFIIF